MKRCPECRRDYYDDTLLYCLDDGNALLEGPGKSEPGAIATGLVEGDEPATAFLSEPPAVAGGLTEPTAQLDEPATAIFPRGAEAEPQRNLRDSTEKPSFSANRAVKPLIVAVVAVAVLVSGFFVYRYLKPVDFRTDQFNRRSAV